MMNEMCLNWAKWGQKIPSWNRKWSLDNFRFIRVKFIYSEKVTKSSPYFWLALHRTKVRWRFRKILWPSQNIWTLSHSFVISIGKLEVYKTQLSILITWINAESIFLIIFCFVFNRDGWKWNLNILWMSWKRFTKANFQEKRRRNQSQMNHWVETTLNLTKTMSKVSG